MAGGCASGTWPAVRQPSIHAGGLEAFCRPSLLSFAFDFFFCTISLSFKRSESKFFFFLSISFMCSFVLAVPGPWCCGGCSPGMVCGLLPVGASLVAGHGPQGVLTSAVVAPQF